MASKKSKAPPTKRAAMPQSTLSPLPSTKRRKRLAVRVNAAVCMEEPLYLQALRKAESVSDNNFSAYVRRLIRRDLGHAA